MRGRSCMTMDPRIPMYNAGTEHVGFSPTRQTLLCSKREGRGGGAYSLVAFLAFVILAIDHAPLSRRERGDDTVLLVGLRVSLCM